MKIKKIAKKETITKLRLDAIQKNNNQSKKLEKKLDDLK